MFTLDYIDLVRDPIHKYIEITQIEMEIINSNWFQRLRHIKQTPSVSYVYPGATHTRFEHSLGVMHVAGKWVEHLMRNAYIDGDPEMRKWIKKQVQKIRIAGMLHDIGTGPFSHSFEFYFLMELGRNDINHEKLGLKIIDEIFAPLLLSGKWDLEFDEDDIQDIKAMIEGNIIHPEHQFLYQIVANKRSIDVDKIDYLLRDAYYSGAVEYGGIDADRLLLNSEIGEQEQIVFSTRSYYTYQHFWLARAHMYRNLYLHRTSIAFDIFFGILLKAIEGKYGIINKIEADISYYRNLNDSTFIELYRNDETIGPIIDKLEKREIPKIVFEKELSVEYQFIAGQLRKNSAEILKELKNNLLAIGLSPEQTENVFFEVSDINLPTIIKNIWIDKEGNLLEDNPTSLLDVIKNLLVIFLRVYSLTDLSAFESGKLLTTIRVTLSSWMERNGLTKGDGIPPLNY